MTSMMGGALLCFCDVERERERERKGGGGGVVKNFVVCRLNR